MSGFISNERSEKVDLFLKEISEVCKKHGLSISHEDEYGAFLIVPFKESYLEWLLNAHEEP